MRTEEAEMRMGLRVYHDTWLRGQRGLAGDIPAIRQGRRMQWLDTVLEPLGDLSDGERHRLKTALALVVGADPAIMLKDVCRLNNDEAFDVLRRSAVALLRAER